MGPARLGILAVFFLHGAGAGMWVARIPAVQEHLGLGVRALGLALLGAGLGTLTAMASAGCTFAPHGSRAAGFWTAWPAALTLGLPGVAPARPALLARPPL